MEGNTLSMALQHKDMRLKVMGVVHKQTQVIKPVDLSRSPFIQNLIIDQKDRLVASTYINAKRPPIKLEIGKMYILDIMTSLNKEGVLSAKLYEAVETKGELQRWYDNEYMNWLDKNNTPTVSAVVQSEVGRKNHTRVDMCGQVTFVGTEVKCSTGSMMNAYSLKDKLGGSVSVTTFGFKQFVVDDVVYMRNVKYSAGKYTADELSDVIVGNIFQKMASKSQEIEGTTNSQNYQSQESNSSLCAWSERSFLAAASPDSPNKKKMKLAFHDTDSFYSDIIELYQEQKDTCDLRKCLSILGESSVLDYIDVHDLLRCVVDAIDQNTNMNNALIFLGKVLTLIKVKPVSKDIQVETDGAVASLCALSIEYMLQKFVSNIAKADLFKLYQEEMSMPSIDSVLVLIRSAISNMKTIGGERKNFRKKIMDFFEK